MGEKKQYIMISLFYLFDFWNINYKYILFEYHRKQVF